MSELDPLLNRAAEWRGARMAIATVISTWGSAPRPRGSHMLVHEDGRFEGSVSGGCVEAAVMAAAEEVIATGTFQRLRYGVADDAAWEAGLPCGGEIEIIVQPVAPTGFPADLLDGIGAARAEGAAFSATTSLADGLSRASRAGDLGLAGVFVNRYDPPHRLLIVGAVQIAQSLVELARAMDMVVTVVDPRGRFLTAERFPGAILDDRWPDEAVDAFRPDPSSAIVTLSHDIKIDDPALIAALRSDAGYIGALGSRRSHARRCERLAAAGCDADSIARVDGPAGLDIGAVGPAEIALSIAAAMVQAFNRERLRGELPESGTCATGPAAESKAA
jgi:xanthine dehydrogenase accessory factor